MTLLRSVLGRLVLQCVSIVLLYSPQRVKQLAPHRIAVFHYRSARRALGLGQPAARENHNL
jgi:hypothetical protein